MPSSTKPTPHPNGPHTTDHHDDDPRPHVAALITLGALGWYVTQIRPDRIGPGLWRVPVERFDGHASISVIEVDPDDALDEAIRYAAIDRRADPGDAPDAVACAAAVEGPSDPELSLNERAPKRPQGNSDLIDGSEIVGADEQKLDEPPSGFGAYANLSENYARVAQP